MTLEQKVTVEFASRGNLQRALLEAKREALALNRAMTDATVGRATVQRQQATQALARSSSGVVAAVAASAVAAGITATMVRQRRAATNQLPAREVEVNRSIPTASVGPLRTAGPSMPNLPELNVQPGMPRRDMIAEVMDQRQMLLDRSQMVREQLKEFTAGRRSPKQSIEKQQRKITDLQSQSQAASALVPVDNSVEISAAQQQTDALRQQRDVKNAELKKLTSRKEKDQPAIDLAKAERDALTEQIRQAEATIKSMQKASTTTARPQGEIDRINAQLQAEQAKLQQMQNPRKPIDLAKLYKGYFEEQKQALEAIRAMSRQRLNFLRGVKPAGTDSATVGRMIAAPERREQVNDYIRRGIRTDRLQQQEEIEFRLRSMSILNRNLQSPATQQQLGKMQRARLATEALGNRNEMVTLQVENRQMGSKEFRDANRSRVQLDSAQQLTATRKEVALLAERERFLSSPKGMAALRDQLRMQEQIARSQKAISYQRLVAEVGPFAAKMQTASASVSAFRQGLQGVESAAVRMFAVGSGAIVGLSKLANPFAFDQFSRSIADLGAVVGRTLVPYLEMVTHRIRDVANWFMALDPEIRKSVGGFVFWGTAIAGGTFVLGKMIGVVGTLIGALGKLGIVMRGIGAVMKFTFASPWLLAALGVAGVAGLATDQLLKLTTGRGVVDRIMGRDDARDPKQPSLPQRRADERPFLPEIIGEFKEGLNQADIIGAATKNRLARQAALEKGVSPEEAAKIGNIAENQALEMLKRYQQIPKNLRQEAEAEIQALQQELPGVNNGNERLMRRFQIQQQFVEKFLKQQSQQSMLPPGLTREQAIGRIWSGNGSSEGAAGGGNPQFMAISQLRDYIQLQAIQRQPIESEQKQANRLLGGIQDELRAIRDELAMADPVPMGPMFDGLPVPPMARTGDRRV